METETKRTKKVLLVYTGGTIGMDKNPKTGALEPLNFSHLLEKIREWTLRYLWYRKKREEEEGGNENTRVR